MMSSTSSTERSRRAQTWVNAGAETGRDVVFRDAMTLSDTLLLCGLSGGPLGGRGD